MTSPTRRQIARDLLRQTPTLTDTRRTQQALSHVGTETTEQYILQQPDADATTAAVNATRVSSDPAPGESEGQK
ncbi:hypothetical protein ACIQ9J_17960 [Streptomyces sp. NPDC094153]|uniref:hypothetical protein n=1 Tax=Streptomyces sp. NPDC094153 TaxID=3366058 RepID=UPI0037F660F7